MSLGLSQMGAIDKKFGTGNLARDARDRLVKKGYLNKPAANMVISAFAYAAADQGHPLQTSNDALPNDALPNDAPPNNDLPNRISIDQLKAMFQKISSEEDLNLSLDDVQTAQLNRYAQDAKLCKKLSSFSAGVAAFSSAAAVGTAIPTAGAGAIISGSVAATAATAKCYFDVTRKILEDKASEPAFKAYNSLRQQITHTHVS